jgi:methyl-accepting chemotaxis protein
MFWKRMSIGKRLSLGFGLVIVLLAIVAGTSLVRLSNFNERVEAFSSVRVPKLITAAALVDSLLQSSRLMREAMLLDDEKQVKAALASVQKAVQERADLRGKLEKMLAPGRETELFQAIVAAGSKYEPHEREFLTVSGRADYATAKDIMLERVAPAQLEYQKAISALTEYQVAQTEIDAASASTAYKATAALLIALSALAVGVAVAAAWLIIRGLVTQLRKTVDILQDLAEGDLTKRLSVDTRDEVGQVGEWVNQFVDKLREIIGQARETAQHVAGATQALSAATEQLSSGAQEQASSLEETAASLEEITGTVKQNADNARQANQLALGSRDVADKGGRVVAEAVEAMNDINHASKRIADIITTIDEIAFQTNLLALNAAVEAARAGEQGRGFAVVAAEVRNLAQRSATAAKEIKELIQDSVAKVEGGAALVNRSGETLGEIVSSVKRVTDIIAEIAAATGEQSTGIDQVNKVVSQMDTITQSNAAQTDELSSMSQSLATQARQLHALVGKFKLAESRPARPAAAAASVRAASPVPEPVKVQAATPEAVLAGANGHARNGHARNGHANGHAARPEIDGFEEF